MGKLDEYANTIFDETGMGILSSVYTAGASTKRLKWLRSLYDKDMKLLMEESPRLTAVMNILETFYTPDAEPGARNTIVITSTYMKFLDMVELCIEGKYEVTPLRYDGS